MSIVLDHGIDGFDVWKRWVVVVLDQILHHHWALPVNRLDVEAEVTVH